MNKLILLVAAGVGASAMFFATTLLSVEDAAGEPIEPIALNDRDGDHKSKGAERDRAQLREVQDQRRREEIRQLEINLGEINEERRRAERDRDSRPEVREQLRERFRRLTQDLEHREREHREREHREREHREREHQRKHEHEDAGIRESLEKIEHLRAAAEHLDHAGMGDLANQLRQQSEQMQRDVHQHRERRGDRHQQEIQRAIEELRAAVRRLHAEVRELHKRLDDDDDDDRRKGDRDRDEDREEDNKDRSDEE